MSAFCCGWNMDWVPYTIQTPQERREGDECRFERRSPNPTDGWIWLDLKQISADDGAAA
jgi:hypothetical protein